MASSSNATWFCNISNVFSSQQPTIDVLVMNLIDSLCTKSSPLGFPLELFGIDAPILFPPLDVLALITKQKWVL